MKKEHSGSLAGRTETERVAGFSAISLIMDFPLSSVGDSSKTFPPAREKRKRGGGIKRDITLLCLLLDRETRILRIPGSNFHCDSFESFLFRTIFAGRGKSGKETLTSKV